MSRPSSEIINLVIDAVSRQIETLSDINKSVDKLIEADDWLYEEYYNALDTEAAVNCHG